MAETVKYFGTNRAISGCFPSIPLKWVSSATKPRATTLHVLNSKNETKNLKFKSYVATAVFLLLIIQCIQAFLDNTSSESENVINIMLLGLLTECIVCLNWSQMRASELAAFINALLEFDQLYPTAPNKLKDMSLQRLTSIINVKALILTEYLLPVGATFGLHWNNPWKASLAGYWLIPNPGDFKCGILSKIYLHGTKLIVMAFNCWFWMFVVGAGCIVNAVVHNVCISALLRCIET